MPRRLLLALGAILLATLLVLGILIAIPWPVVVEMEVLARRTSFVVVGQQDASMDATVPASATADEIPLFSRSDVLHLAVDDADRMEVMLEGVGQSSALPQPGGRFLIQSSLRPPPGFRIDLSAFGATALTVETLAKTHSGNQQLALELGTEDSGKWRGGVSGKQLQVEFESMEILPVGSPGRGRVVESDLFNIPDIGPEILVDGGKRLSRLGLTLAPAQAAGTHLTVVDPLTGEMILSKSLPLALPDHRAVTWNDHLVLLEPEPTPESEPLLQQDLAIQGLKFLDPEKRRQESAILEGEIRFPNGEKEPVEITARSFLSVDSRTPLTLRSLRLHKGALHLKLSGRVSRLRLGATPDLQSELLPSLFLWIYTSKLRGLVYATVASILGASLTFFKMFGLLDKPPGGTMARSSRIRKLLLLTVICLPFQAEAQDLDTLLRAQTVMISVSRDTGAAPEPGSGIILCQEESQAETHILTARHVVFGKTGEGVPAPSGLINKIQISFFQNAIPPVIEERGSGVATITKQIAPGGLDLLLLTVSIPQRVVAASFGKLEGDLSGQAVRAIGRQGSLGTWVEREGLLVGRSAENNASLIHTAPIEEGFSGGPLFDNRGNLIGINVETDGDRGLALAIDQAIPAILKWLPSSCLQRASPASAKAEAREDYRNAMRLISLKDWQEAEQLLESIVAKDFVEGGENVHLQGMRYTVFLPHYHLGLAIYKQKRKPKLDRCDAALEQWAISDLQGVIQKDKRYRTMKRFQARCREIVKGRFASTSKSEETRP